MVTPINNRKRHSALFREPETLEFVTKPIRTLICRKINRILVYKKRPASTGYLFIIGAPQGFALRGADFSFFRDSIRHH